MDSTNTKNIVFYVWLVFWVVLQIRMKEISKSKEWGGDSSYIHPSPLILPPKVAVYDSPATWEVCLRCLQVCFSFLAFLLLSGFPLPPWHPPGEKPLLSNNSPSQLHSPNIDMRWTKMLFLSKADPHHPTPLRPLPPSPSPSPGPVPQSQPQSQSQSRSSPNPSFSFLLVSKNPF